MKKYPVDKLNEAQRKISEWTFGPVIILGSPGSGKTRSIIERITSLINNGVDPNTILATTFTRKAADEMNSRLRSKKINTNKMSVQTMHALCWRIIREHKQFKGWKVDDKDIGRLVLKDIIGYKNLNWYNCDITLVEQFISSARNNLIDPKKSKDFKKEIYEDERYHQAYVMYSDEMSHRKLVSFDDMLYYGVDLLEKDIKVKNKQQSKYQYVIVDECQDSNYAQISLANIIAHPEYNYMIVGDIDQAIYSWRGAIPQFMLQFQDKHNAELIELNTNYRSTSSIVDIANKCIINNKERFPREIIPFNNNNSEIKLIKPIDQDEEASLIREEISILHKDNINYGNIRILMRTNAQSRAIEEELIRFKIPFIVLGNVSFYQRKEIRDLLSYLRLINNPHDISSGEIAINRPFRYIGRRQLDEIKMNVNNNTSYIEATEKIIGHNYKVKDFISLINDANKNDPPPIKILKEIINKTNYLSYIKNSEGSDTMETSRIDNVNELIASSARFNNVSEFIDHVDLQIRLRKKNQRKNIDSRVQVMTIHKAKGDEAHTVFIIGANEGVIPHSKGNIEEERRLFYVAITRAKNNLVVSTLKNPEIHEKNKEPSRFLYEIELIKDR